MPSAAPVPRGPSVLLLGSSAGLLTVTGCPACRYLAESSDAYLAWFALEGHADPDVLHRMCASRGMCARHTRRLLAQPGAAFRMTAVYQYVVAAVAQDLSAGICPRPSGCLSCDQEARAEDRVLGALLENFTAEARAQYQEHGGLCLPHLRRAAHRHRSQDLRWLIRFMITRLRAPGPGLDLLAGWPDPGAASRAAHPAGPGSGPPGGPAAACRACWAAARAETAKLAEVRPAGRGPSARPVAGSLCGPHLRDAATAERPTARRPRGFTAPAARELAAPQAEGLLAGQAEGEARRLAQVLQGRPRLLGISPGWLSPRTRRALAEPDCGVCRGRDEAAASTIARLRAVLRDAAVEPAEGLPLCARHAIRLRAVDAQAARPVLGALGGQAVRLVAQLDAAFTVQARAYAQAQHGNTRYPEPNAWRQAAVFLDGSVFSGCAVD
jgi:hypothetical protein